MRCSTLRSAAPSNLVLLLMNSLGISTFGIIAIILFVFAATGFFRGFIRTTLGITCLAISGYCAYWMHQNVYQLITPWISNPQPWLCGIIAIGAGLAAFIISRYIFQFVIDPFNVSKTGQRIGFGFPAALITLAIGSAFIWLSLAGVRYLGSAAELQQTRFQISNKDEPHDTWSIANQHIIPHFISAKQWLNSTSLGSWHSGTDLFHPPGKVQLCQLLILYHHQPSRLTMLKDKMFSELLNDTAFLELAHAEETKKISASDYPVGLLSSPHVKTALTNKVLSQKLAKFSSEDFDAISSE